MGLAPGAPQADQVEISVLGPGFGECIVVHLGNGKWAIVDSCFDRGAVRPAALAYFSELGVRPEAVQLIVATHWHDDHIRGLSEIVAECPSAKFCMSSALGRAEFLAVVSAFENNKIAASSSGVREIYTIHRILRERGDRAIKAAANRPVLVIEPELSGHGFRCCATTLSPSDAQIDKFYEEIASMMPRIKQTKYRSVAQTPNRLAVAMWIDIGSARILLGSDLENSADPESGWAVIVKSTERPQGLAQVYKVAHHGSKNAHHQGIWTDMLGKNPIAVLTPYNRGSKLPSADDVARICELTPRAYSTSNTAPRRSRKRYPAAVERTLREGGFQIVESEPPTGLVRLRNGGRGDFETWTIELKAPACELSKIA